MKIQHLEATDMGTNQSEIADKVMEYVAGVDFKTAEDFTDQEYQLIIRACNDLKWWSVPSVGGLEIYWDSQDGDFSDAGMENVQSAHTAGGEVLLF